jgi:16S rRNA (uracil1498-N3)-methyltransferase
MSIFLMPRFFVSTPLNPDDVMQLPDDVVRHVLVLRLQAGDSIVLFNGEGGEYSAELVDVERRSVSVRIREFRPIEVEPPYQLTLAQGIAGGDKMDWLIEKAVELGASCFVPLTTTRSVVRLSGERAQRRHAHWQGIVRASCEQCGRNRLPEVMPVREIATWLGALAREPAEGELRILLSPRATISFTALPATPPSGRVIVLVGPEGGFSAAEEAAATDHGFTAVGLGPRVLRTETAGIAVLSGLAARWGGW